MKRVYRSKLWCLNLPLWSLFLILSANLEVKAEEKSLNFNEINIQLANNTVSNRVNTAIALTLKNQLTPAVIGNQIQKTRQTVSTSAIDLLAQQNTITRVTGVEVKQTDSGLQIILKTIAQKQQLVPLILPEGNKLAIDILDATLASSIRNGVTKSNPAPGIKEVRIAKIDDSSIRLTIAGEKNAPTAEVVPSNQNLILSVTSQENTAQTKPEQEIVITATRKEEQTADVPRSVTVIDQEEIAEQSRTSRDLVDIIGKTTPGVNPPTGSTRSLSVRGRAAQVLINGVPVSSITTNWVFGENGTRYKLVWLVFITNQH